MSHCIPTWSVVLITAVLTAPGAFGSATEQNRVCGIALDYAVGTIKPADDSSADNPTGASAQLTKHCSGPVIGTFSGVIYTPVQGSFISIDMRATCIRTGGFAYHCTVGEQVLAKHEHTILEGNYHPNPEADTITMIWPWLRSGQWQFEVLLGGDGEATVSRRTFTAVAAGK